jgi:hypothetical protein
MHGEEKKHRQITALLTNEIPCYVLYDARVGFFTVSETHWIGQVEDWDGGD